MEQAPARGYPVGDSGSSQVRVLVADSQPIYRQGVVEAVDSCEHLLVVAQATTGMEVLCAVEDQGPRVALVDARLPVIDGLAVVKRLTHTRPSCRVVLLSESGDGESAYCGLAAGAAGYLSKTADGEAVCEAVLRVARGETVVSPCLAGGVLHEIRTHAAIDGLSSRESEVLNLVARGLTNKAIAADLYVSPASVKTYLSRIYEKLSVPDRAAAVAEGFRRGLLS